MQKFINKGVVVKLISLLNPNLSADVVEGALWTLGNIIGENTECRDYCIN
jgi:hypothetical protein